MRTLPILIAIIVQNCTPRFADIAAINEKFGEAAFMPSGDGWAEARRRRLVTRYLERAGFEVVAEQLPFEDGRAETKYRQVNLYAHRPSAGAYGRRARLTLVLLRPEVLRVADDFTTRQKRCDKILLSALEHAAEYSYMELVTAPVCFSLTAQRSAQK